MGNSWYPVVQKIPVLGNVIKIIVLIFGTTRNGLFEGVPCLIIGGLIDANKQNKNIKSTICVMILGIFLLLVEPLFLNLIEGIHSFDLGIGIFIFCVGFMTILTQNEIDGKKEYGRFLRNLSTLVLLLHPLCYYIGYSYFRIDLLDNWMVYTIISLVSSWLAAGILFLQKKRKFEWLKNFH